MGHWCTNDNPQTHDNSDWKSIGADYSNAYHWPSYATTALPAKTSPGYWPDDQVIAAQKYCWEGQAKGAVPNIVTCSMGFDDPPWSGRMRFCRLAPNGSEILLQTAKSFVSSRDSNNLEGRVIMIDNWNHCCPR